MLKHNLLMLFVVAALWFANQAAVRAADLPDDCWGVYSWCSWNPRLVNRENCPNVVGVPLVVSWKDIEPAPGEYRFDEMLGDRLKAAKENGFYVFLMLWVGPSAPRWIYEEGVPEVECTPTINPKGERRTATYPYYLDEDHTNYFHRLIRAYGDYVLSLPKELGDLIIFVQVAEGSTGDGWGYKGDPLESRYAISREEWGDFRIQTWDVYREAFSRDGRLAVRLMVNDDSSESKQHKWQMANLDAIGCKQGMFSHGYHISDTVERLARWREFSGAAQRAGKSVFSRGEQDAEWQVCGWSSRNPLQGLYWSALFATHCGLDIWNVPSEACQGDVYGPALEFFNKYAGHRAARTAPSAFCALRRGLDASDVGTFPEEAFGTANKRSIDRYLKIAEAFSKFGAYQGDPAAATGGGMKNRQRKDYNDVGWGILPGNYCRFIEQVAPDETSQAWWHAGPEEHHFSRFARGFNHATGKKAMYFRLDDEFFADKQKPAAVLVRVVYLDRGDGSWTLGYAGAEGPQAAGRVSCRNTGQWLEKQFSIDAAVFDRLLPNRCDLVLEYTGGDDTLFHMIELDRR